MLIKDAVRRFLEYLEARVRMKANRPATVDFYRYNLAHLLASAADLDMSEVTLEVLSRLPATNHMVRCVRRLFAHFKLTVPEGYSQPRVGQRTRVLSAREFRRLWQCAPGHVYPLLMKLIYHTGMRPREACDLKWGDVREVERVIVLTDFKARHLRRDGLTKRIIPMPMRAARLFCWFRERLKPGPRDRVFSSMRMGRPISVNSFGLMFRQAAMRAGLLVAGQEGVSPYNLRHSFATNYMRAGGDSLTLKVIMGHTEVAMTDRYCHPTEEDVVAGYDRSFPQPESYRLSAPVTSETPPPEPTLSESLRATVDMRSLCRLLKCSDATIRHIVREGWFPSPEGNRNKHHWPRSVVLEWKERHGEALAARLSLSRWRGKRADHCPEIEANVMGSKELAKRLTCSHTQLMRLVRARKIPPPAILGPKSWRWSRVVIEKWLAEGMPDVSAPGNREKDR